MRQEIDRKSSQRGVEGWILEDFGFFSKNNTEALCGGGGALPEEKYDLT